MQNHVKFVWNQEIERGVHNGIFLEEEVTLPAHLVQRGLGESGKDLE